MWSLVFAALFLGPWVESDETIAPGIGLKVETDRPPWLKKSAGIDDRMLVRADDPGIRKSDDGPGIKKKDFRPPIDVAADRINESASTVRPVFVTKNQIEIGRVAEELGKPVLWWSFWPDNYDTTAAYFNELGEATHLLMTNEQLKRHGIKSGEEWIVYKHKDGEPRWIKASEIYGAGCAAKIRAAWAVSKEPRSKGVTDHEKEAILATTVSVWIGDQSNRETMSLREYISRGYPLNYSDCKALERKGLSEEEIAYAVGLSKSGTVSSGYTGSSGYSAPPARSYSSAVPSYSAPPMQSYSAPPARFQPSGRSFGAPLRGG